MIQTLDLTDLETTTPVPSFTKCLFGEVVGVASPDMLPMDRFTDCELSSSTPEPERQVEYSSWKV